MLFSDHKEALAEVATQVRLAIALRGERAQLAHHDANHAWIKRAIRCCWYWWTTSTLSGPPRTTTRASTPP